MLQVSCLWERLSGIDLEDATCVDIIIPSFGEFPGQLLASLTVSIATKVDVLETWGRLEIFSPSTMR